MYTYNDFKDKTVEGIQKEVSSGLAVIAFNFYTQFGIPKEIFDEMLEEKTKTAEKSLFFYMKMRNLHPEWGWK